MNNTNTSINNLDLIEICERYCRERMLRTASADSYRRCIGVFIGDTGISTVDAITTEILVEWRDQVRERCEPASFNTYHTHLRAILNECVRRKYLDENPLDQISQFRRTGARRKACTQEELESVCQFLQSDTQNPSSVIGLNGALTIYYTGMRRAQLCGLQWQDIDFPGRTIHYRNQHSKTGAEWKIPLHEDLHDILLRMKVDAERRFPGFRKSDQVFFLQRYSPRHVGDRMTEDQFSRILKRASKRCGVRVTAHSIRHLFATILANQEAGTDSGDIPLTLVAVKDILGHRNLSTTIGYIEPRLSAQREVIKGIRGLKGIDNTVPAGT